jgi:hypothetical protein
MNIKTIKDKVVTSIGTNITNMGADTLNWIAIIIGHSIFIPTILALMTGLTDRTPGVDVVILVQAFLLASFARSVLIKDGIASITHGLGWFIQGLLLSMIVFK